MSRITIENFGSVITNNPGLSLLNNFLINKVPIHTVCGGKARCGCCRVRIVEGEKGISGINEREVAKLGKESVEAGSSKRMARSPRG